MTQSKVVIRINVDSNKPPLRPQSKELVVWRKGRIALALLVLVAILSAILVAFNSGNSGKTGLSSLSPAQPTAATEQSAVVVTAPAPAPIIVPPPTAIVSASQNIKLQILDDRPAYKAIIYNKKVYRASLNTIIKDNEPFEQPKFPLKLNSNKPLEIFYFNEIRHAGNKLLFHHWNKDGKTVYKKQLLIETGRAKVASSRKFTHNDQGFWSVQLVDAKGKIFSEVDFLVDFE